MRIVTTVSVIIATYNRPKMLKRAISSALDQGDHILEILICEDGETDECKSIVYGFGNERIRYLPGCFSGRPAIPRNRGIKAAKGEWIAFLDDDDQWSAHKTDIQLKTAYRYKLDFLSTNTELCPKGSRLLHFQDFIKSNNICLSSVLIKKSLLVTGFCEWKSLRALEDYHLWLQMSLKSPCIDVGSNLTYYSHQTEDSIRISSRESGAKETLRVLVCFLLSHQNLPGVTFKTKVVVVIRILQLAASIIKETLLCEY